MSIGLTGTTNINTSGAATTSIGTGTGNKSAISCYRYPWPHRQHCSTKEFCNTSINTTGTSTTTIGSATAGAVSITSNAASSFTTNTGALTLSSAAAATWVLTLVYSPCRGRAAPRSPLRTGQPPATPLFPLAMPALVPVAT